MHNINHSVTTAEHSKSLTRRKRSKKKLSFLVKALLILLLLYIGFFSGIALIASLWSRKEDRTSALASSLSSSRTSEQSYKKAQGGGVKRTILRGATLSKDKETLPINNDSGRGAGKSASARVKEMNFTNVSFAVLYMVKDRVEYLSKSLESLRKSDFPKESSIPVIFSHDGRVPEMMSFIESLRGEFNIIQMFHPHSCYDNPYSFPANDTSLNDGYEGDTYGNLRSPWATCAKHHWWWMTNAIWSMADYLPEYVFFMEEDYEVAPTIYETIISGLSLLKASNRGDYFGLALEIPKNIYIDTTRFKQTNVWCEQPFTSSPMVIGRYALERIHANADEFCVFDEYNWDWSVIRLQYLNKVPGKVLCPSVRQVKHIGYHGMHGDTDVLAEELLPLEPFHGKDIVEKLENWEPSSMQNGGWGHSRDHDHCRQVAKNATNPAIPLSPL